MCKPHPGPRCASHTRKRVISVKKRLIEVNKRLKSVEDRISKSAANGVDPTETQVTLQERLREKKTLLTDDLRLAVRSYDSTKTGQSELREKISSTEDAVERNILKRRLRQGEMLAGWHKSAWERHKTQLKNSAA